MMITLVMNGERQIHPVGTAAADVRDETDPITREVVVCSRIAAEAVLR